MEHPIFRVVALEVVGAYRIRVTFDDGLVRTIDLADVLHGALYGPLRDTDLFARASIDPEAQTVVWPNGADFDPATLHDWPIHGDAWRKMARSWKAAAVG